MFDFRSPVDKTVKPICAEGALQNSEWTTVLVAVQRPTPEALQTLNRSARYGLLCKNGEYWRNELLDWIKTQGLQAEVRSVGAPTVFCMIIVVCTVRVAKLLANAPGVTNVIIADEPALEAARI